MNAKNTITVAIATFLVALNAQAQTIMLRFTDTALDGGFTDKVHSIMYNASNTSCNLESRLGGTAPLAPCDDQRVSVQPSVQDPALMLVVLPAFYLATHLAVGDIIQSISYWPSFEGLKLSWDSILYDGTAGYVRLGLNDSVTVQRPTVTRDRGRAFVQWFTLADPVELVPGDSDPVPGALIGWNLYQVNYRGDARFVAHLPNDNSSFSIVVEEPGGIGHNVPFRYGIVPVFRSQGLAIGPQGQGIELRKAVAPDVTIPMLTLN